MPTLKRCVRYLQTVRDVSLPSAQVKPCLSAPELVTDRTKAWKAIFKSQVFFVKIANCKVCKLRRVYIVQSVVGESKQQLQQVVSGTKLKTVKNLSNV